jgi:NADPH:quinone reductase
LKVGERVAGFHEMDTPNGTYAEYAICPAQTIFRIPDSMSDEEAATFPLAIYTAAVGLYRNLDIPAPWTRSDGHAPRGGKVALIVNGGASSVGAFAIKLAKLNPNISPIIATAGSSSDFVKSLGVDAIVDYRSSTAAEDIKKAAEGVPIKYAIDVSNTNASVKYITEVLHKDGRYTSTTPVKANAVTKADGSQERMLQEAGVWFEPIWCGDVHGTATFGAPGLAGGVEFGAAITRIIENAIFAGKLKGHPYEVVPDGLDGIYDALVELKERKRGGNAKFVTRIADTPSLKSKL